MLVKTHMGKLANTDQFTYIDVVDCGNGMFRVIGYYDMCQIDTMILGQYCNQKEAEQARDEIYYSVKKREAAMEMPTYDR